MNGLSLSLRENLWIPRAFIPDLEEATRGLIVPTKVEVGGETTYRKEYEVTDTHLVVPRFSMHLHRPLEVHLNPTSRSPQFRTSPTLRDYQVGPLSNILEGVLRDLGGTVNMTCGSGKTVLGMFASYEYAKRWPTPIYVVTDQLGVLEQWRAGYQELFGVPKEQIGVVGAGRLELDKDIVLCSMATLVQRDFPEWFFKRPRFVIYDEVHHAPADAYSKSLSLFNAVRLALTATYERKDGWQRLVDWHVGPILHRDLSYRVDYDLYLLEVPGPEKVSGKTISEYWAAVGRVDIRNAFILKLVDFLREQGRRVLAVGVSKEHLRGLHKGTPNSALITQEVPPLERPKVLREHDITYGIWKCVRDGLDAEDLDCVVLLFPFNNYAGYTQVAGRALREKPGKKRPIVIMLRDPHNRARSMRGKLLAKIRAREEKEAIRATWKMFTSRISSEA